MSQRKIPKRLSSIDLDELRDLYVVKKLTLAETAKALGISISSVWKLLNSLGIERRSIGQYSLEEARSLYFDHGLTLKEISQKFGVSVQAVQQRFAHAGIDLKARKKPENLPDPIRLRELFVYQNMTQREIASELQTSIHFVSKGIRHYGYSRPPRLRHFDREVIVNLYVDQGLLQKEVAERLGVSVYDVLAELKRHNITFRHSPGARIARPDRETVAALYTRQDLTVTEIGRRLGVSGNTVTNLILRYGIERRQTAAQRSGIRKNRELLYELYVINRMSSAQIAQTLGIHESYVNKCLRFHGIEKRPLKITLEREVIKKLIVDEALSYRRAAKKLGVSCKVLIREVRRYGLSRPWPTRTQISKSDIDHEDNADDQ